MQYRVTVHVPPFTREFVDDTWAGLMAQIATFERLVAEEHTRAAERAAEAQEE